LASIKQRPEGTWQAKVRRKGWPAQTRTFRTKALAESWARAIEGEMDRGAFVSRAEAERTTLDDLAERFRREFAPHHYRGEGWKHKLERLLERLGQYSLIAITPEIVAAYRDERLRDPDPRYKDPEKAPRVSGATVKTELDLLAKMLDVAQKEFGIALPLGNPVHNIRKPKSSESRQRRLTSDEWAKLEEACKQSRNSWLHPALLLAVETAMRQGELLNLKRADVDKAKQTAWLKETKNGEPRAVPLTSRAIKVIEGLPRSTTGLVLPVEKQALHSAFKTACRRAGIEDYRWHDLRHEALSRFAERGDLSVLELAAISGHKSASSLKMLQVYVQFHASKLAEKLG
jgi:integrase